MTSTPEPTLTTRELELRRRLGDLAARATVDDAAWDRLQDRIADAVVAPTRRRPGLPRPPRRVVTVAAAVVLLVVGVAVVGWRANDRDRVDTTDDSTTTTVDRDGRSRTTTTATTLGPGDQPPDGVTGGSSGSGTGSVAGTGAGPGAGDASGSSSGATTPPGGGSPGPGTTPTTAPDPNAAPDGRVPVLEYSINSEVGVRATVWQDAGGFHMSLWQYNPWRHLTTWSWSNVPGQNCFAGASATFEIPELAPFSSELFSWGFVRADAATVGVITGPTDAYDAASPRVIGPEVFPGLRPWIANTNTADPIQRFRAISVDNTTLHYADPPTWDARPDTC